MRRSERRALRGEVLEWTMGAQLEVEETLALLAAALVVVLAANLVPSSPTLSKSLAL